MVPNRGRRVDVDIGMVDGMEPPKREDRMLDPMQQIADEIKRQATRGQHRPRAAPSLYRREGRKVRSAEFGQQPDRQGVGRDDADQQLAEEVRRDIRAPAPAARQQPRALLGIAGLVMVAGAAFIARRRRP